ncbi:MAG TPA: ECF-type sigma factor [Vicinamibacteria bacterium]|nr:ECF-type sigma factor [Vicinamibacteria bacterium]
MAEPGEITRLLRAYEAGDEEAFNRLVPLVYDELRGIARGQRRRGPGLASIDTTALVHEAYLKLAGAEQLSVADRAHLLAVAASAMRQVLIDRARGRLRAKRGAGQVADELEDHDFPVAYSPEWLIDLDRALALLRRHDERLVRVFECRFFGGLSEAETAEALGIPLRTVQRDWMRARAWLRAELGEPPSGRA